MFSDSDYNSLTPKDVNQIVNIDEDVADGRAFVIANPRELKKAHDKIKMLFSQSDSLSAADRALLEDFPRFIKTAEVRATSMDKKELYLHGAFTLVDYLGSPRPLYINNWVIGEFSTKLDFAESPKTMDDEGNRLDSSTGRPVEPIAPEGQKLGDQLVFVAANRGPYHLHDMEFEVCEPAAALACFINNKLPQEENLIYPPKNYKGVRYPRVAQKPNVRERE